DGLVDEVNLQELRDGLASGFWRRSLCGYSQRFKAKVRFVLGPNDGDGALPAPVVVSQTAVVKGFESSDPMTTGGTVWDAALLMSMYLEGNRDAVAGCRMLELGAGTGVTGLIASRFGAKSVVLTDLPSMLPLLQMNRDLNFPSDNNKAVTVRPLVWQEALQDPLIAGGHDFDCILMSDVLYHVPQYEPLLIVVRALACMKRGTAGLRFLWSQEVHQPELYSRLREELTTAGWQVDMLIDHDDGVGVQCFLCQLFAPRNNNTNNNDNNNNDTNNNSNMSTSSSACQPQESSNNNNQPTTTTTTKKNNNNNSNNDTVGLFRLLLRRRKWRWLWLWKQRRLRIRRWRRLRMTFSLDMIKKCCFSDSEFVQSTQPTLVKQV
ncbi:unnamed protein product, partial [Polarella glacialis]